MMNWHSAYFRRIVVMMLVLLMGGIVSLCCVGGDVHLWMQSLGLAPWALALATAVRLFAAMALVVAFVTCLKLIHPPARGDVTFWLGKAVAFFPVNILAWSFLGGWIGQLGHPIWSLMPMTEPESSLSSFEAWARWSWTWIPVVGLISVPLTGQYLSLSFEKEARARDAGINLFGLFALVLTLCVEDIFAIRGAATHLTVALHLSDPLNLAAAVWMLTLISLLLAALSVSKTWIPEHMDSRLWVKLLLSATLKISAWCLSGYVLLPSLWEKPQSRVGTPGLLSAFDDPAALLYSGIPWMLAALILWALGHIVRHR